MTSQNSASSKKKVPTPVIIIAILCTFLFCICCICPFIFSVGQSIGVFPTSEPTKNSPTSQSSPITDASLTPLPTETTPTAIPETSQIQLSLSQFIDEYNNATDMQKKKIPEQSKDKWVTWSGEVQNVSEDGTIMVKIPNTIASFVDVKGIPSTTAEKISKNQTISFTGRITNMIDFLGMRITIEDAQLLDVPSTEATPTNSQETDPATETPQPQDTPVTEVTPTTESIATLSHPLGTTGRCADGTYTQAQHSQGACSRHGGLAEWWGP